MASSVPSDGEVEGRLRSAYRAPSASTCCSPPSFTRADHDERRDNDDENGDEGCRFHKLLRNADGAPPPAVHGPLQRLLGDAVVTVLPDMPQRTQGSCPDAQQPKR